jgi:hypothetical protein
MKMGFTDQIGMMRNRPAPNDQYHKYRAGAMGSAGYADDFAPRKLEPGGEETSPS